MFKELVNNLLESLSLLIVVLIFIFKYRDWALMRGMKILFMYFLLAFINTAFATGLAFLNKQNVFWYNLNGFCSLASLTWFFYNLSNDFYQKKIILWGGLIGLFLFLYILFYWDNNITFFSPGYAIGSLLIILFSLLYLKEELTRKNSLHNDRTIWIICALLTYYLCSFLIHVSYKYLTNNFLAGKLSHTFFTPGNLWGIHNVILFLSCIAVSINILKQEKIKIID
jgi:hypothetical protein